MLHIRTNDSDFQLIDQIAYVGTVLVPVPLNVGLVPHKYARFYIADSSRPDIVQNQPIKSVITSSEKLPLLESQVLKIRLSM